ncbi:MAG: hypothetical protein IKK70_07025 [Clostridia bacterium]|nr:hypothetical protein [Clostridia bacterium]
MAFDQFRAVPFLGCGEYGVAERADFGNENLVIRFGVFNNGLINNGLIDHGLVNNGLVGNRLIVADKDLFIGHGTLVGLSGDIGIGVCRFVDSLVGHEKRAEKAAVVIDRRAVQQRKSCRKNECGCGYQRRRNHCERFVFHKHSSFLYPESTPCLFSILSGYIMVL